MRTSIQTDIDNCTKSIKNITCLSEDLLSRKDKSEALSFLKYRKCLDQTLEVEAVLQGMTIKNERTLTFNPDKTIQQTLSTLSGLGQILNTVKQSQPAKRTTQNTVTSQSKPKVSSQSDPENQTTRFKVNKTNPESSSSRKYSPGNQPSDVTKSGQVSDPVSSSPHQLVQGYQPGAVRKPDLIIKLTRSKKYSVKIEGDSSKCGITGICKTAAGGLCITDYCNNRVKLLDQNYKVVAHCDLSSATSMCSIDSSQVAVTLAKGEVHFIRVTNGQLVKDRMLKLQHHCWGIAHHQGNLYITDGEALYHYTVDGKLVRKYTDSSCGHSVATCAVSPDGDRIYVANCSNEWDGQQLVTLSRDGTVISKLIVSGLCSGDEYALPGIHVTDSGQVLVCGGVHDKISQVDRDGRQRLAKVVTQNDGVTDPTSVYYSKHTGSIIVGMWHNDDIMVFKAH